MTATDEPSGARRTTAHEKRGDAGRTTAWNEPSGARRTTAGNAPAVWACDHCLRRTDLIAALAPRIEIEWRRRAGPARVLALPDEDLLDAVGTAAARRRYATFAPAAARDALAGAGLSAACRCDDRYPASLRELADPPAILHAAGRLDRVGADAAVAVVGARRATDYGLTVAHELGRGLAAAGVSVISGLALGVDAAAHVGALAVAAPAGTAAEGSAPGPAPAPVAVLAGGADRPYPASKRRLHAAVRNAGAVVSELPPGTGIHRWAFIARNRLIAALARVVVVVEAAERSGSLTTAEFGAELGRTVAAVPGRVTCGLAAGVNGLIRDGALLVRGPHDVLDALAELTGATFPAPDRPDGAAGSPALEPATGPALEPALRELLEAVGEGHSTLSMLAARGTPAREVLAGLGALEARGLVRRGFAGRYERVPYPDGHA